jgi:hypothetical protein
MALWVSLSISPFLAFLSSDRISQQQSSFPIPRFNGYASQFRSLFSDPIHSYIFFNRNNNFVILQFLLFLFVSPFLILIKVSTFYRNGFWVLMETNCYTCKRFVFICFFFFYNRFNLFIYLLLLLFRFWVNSVFDFLKLIMWMWLSVTTWSMICVLYIDKLIDGSKVKGLGC